MAISDVQRLGLPCSDSAAGFYVLDSGATNMNTGGTSTVVTATATNNFDGTKPTIREGWCLVQVASLGTAAITGIDVTIGDGSVTIFANTFKVNTNVANQGINWLFPVFATLSDSFANTGINNISATITTNANSTAGTAEVYFFGSN